MACANAPCSPSPCCLDPQILILDEPTTALDILTQRTIISLLRRLKEEQHFTMIFISHDLAIAAELADRVATMYAGRIVEIGKTSDLFYRPRHPYTLGPDSRRAHGAGRF